MMKNRNIQIQGLRGFGCILIVLYHILYRFKEIYLVDYGYKPLLMIKDWGTMGTLLFMVISIYYLVPNNDTRRCIKFADAVLYLKRKFLKLWIPYFFGVILIFGGVNITGLTGREVKFNEFIINLTMLEGFVPECRYVDGAHWYITVLLAITVWSTLIEMQTNKFFRLIGYSFWLGIAVILKFLIPIHDIAAPFFATSFVGVVVFVVMMKYIILDVGNYKYIINNVSNIFCLMFQIILFFCSMLIIYMQRGGLYIIYISISMLLLYLCLNNKLKILKNIICVFIGDISYSIYLIHQNISYVIILCLCNCFNGYKEWYALIAIMLILCLSLVHHHMVNNKVKQL